MRKRIATLLSLPLLLNPMLGASGEVMQTPLARTLQGDCVEKIGLRNELHRQVEEYQKVQWQNANTVEYDMWLDEQEALRIEGQYSNYPHYNPYDLRELSNMSEEQYYKMLEGTRLQTLAHALWYYEQVYQVNGIFVSSLISEESGYGTSYNAMYLNNLGGYKNSNGDYHYFNNWGESLEETFRLISEEYISQDGLFHKGTDIWSVNRSYCVGTQWSSNINTIANELYYKVLN